MRIWRPVLDYVRREPWTFLMAALLTAVMVGSWLAPKTAGAPEDAFSESQRLETTQKIELLAQGMMQNPQARMVIGAAVLGVAALVLLGGIWGAAWMASIRRGERWMDRFGSPRIVWGLGHAFKGVVLLFFLDLIFSAVLGFIFSFFKIGSLNLALMAGSLLRSALILLFLGRMVRTLGGNWGDLGWQGRRAGTQAAWGAAGYLAMIPVYAATLGILMTVLALLKIQPPVQTPVQVLYTESNTALLAAFTVFVGVLGPWFEEIFFRGFLYPAVRERAGVGRGILITSVLFAALHAHGIAFVPILILGLALNLLYERGGSVIPGAVLHMTHNCAMLAATFWIRGWSA